MLAALRPHAFDLPLFLHVLGATTLFGGVLTVAILAGASLRRDAAHAVLLRRAAFALMLAVVWPAFVVMRIGAQWIASKEHLTDNAPTWVGIGFLVSDFGVFVLAVVTILAWLAYRQTRPDARRPVAVPILTGLTSLYLVALAVTWFAMSTKHPT